MRGTYIDSKGNLVRPTQEAINKNTMTYIDKSGNLSSREIMPPVSNKKKKDKWINLEAFDDGFDLVDIPKTILGTAGDVGLRLVKGVSDIGADIGKLGAGGLAQIADWTGHDEYADRLRDALAGKNEKTNEWLKKYTPSGVLEQAGEKIDKYSLAGEKLDKVNESVGQIGAYAASGGVSPLLGTATMFGSSAGGNLSEAYSKEGVTNSQAWIKALAAGGISVVTEKALGFFSNGKGIDTKIANKISSKLTDGASKTFARYGIQATAESVEEFLEYAGNQLLDLGIDATSDNKGAKFHKDWDWEEVGEQMGGAFLASMIVGGGQTALGVRGIKNENNLNTKEAINEYAKQMDVAEGVLTDNEQKVLNKELENRIEEQSKDGKTLSKKEISKLEEQIKNDMSKGRISVETIEEALGGNNTTQNDILLQTSYNERNNRSVAYNADLSKYKGKQKEIVQKAIDSGVLNNTNRSHELVDLVAKLAEDKGMDFDFVNNEKLKDTGFALEGKQVNGYNNGTSIGINIDSNKALNSVIGHEITHVLEGTDLYNELQKSITEYAKTKGEYDTRLKELQELYKDVKDANVENELTSDLVGDYLFTDEDFVNRLYNNNRNVFQKIYDEIKYFVKQVAPGSKEAKQLEQVKRAFEKAYNQSSTNVDNTLKYSTISTKGAKNLQKNSNNSRYNNLYSLLKTAKEISNQSKNGLEETNKKLKKETQWFKTKYGDWGTLISDKDAKITKKLEPNKTYKLGDIFEHDILYKAYPGLENLRVKTIDFGGETGKAGYRPVKFLPDNVLTNDIVINNDWLDKSDFRRTLLHEINHFIEGYEKFNKNSRGANSKELSIDEYRNNLGEIISNETKILSNLTQEQLDNILLLEQGKENPSYENIKEALEKVKQIDNKKGDDDVIRNNRQVSEPKEKHKTQVVKKTTKLDSDGNTLSNRQELDNSSFSIEERTSGDKLLDALGLIDEVKSVGAKVDENGYITLYHQTTNENADKIRETGKMSGKENGIFFSTSENASQAEGRGTTKLEFKIPAEKLILDDLFSDNADLKLNSKPGEQIDVSNYLVDTNTQTSTTDNQGRELSKQQQEYFKDSKVRDDEGRLKIMYHGSQNDFSVFNKTFGGWYGDGYYFTDSKESGIDYAKGLKDNGGKLYETYINITNPYIPSSDVINEDGSVTFAPGFREEFLNNFKNDLPRNWDELNRTEQDHLIQKILKKNNFDGINNGDVWVAFSPEQIKNIDNTNPTTNDDIRFSLSEQNKKIAPVGNYQIKGKDVKLEKIAPVKETKSKVTTKEKVNIPIREDIEAKEIPKNPTKEESYEPVKRTRKDVQNELKTEMGITLEDLDVGKDISSIGYQRTDPIRLNEKVFGAEVGQKINDATINRTKHNEAERTRFLNKERQEIKDLGIKARSTESAAVQKYGEKQYVDDKGVIHKYGDTELAAEFPNVETQNKIKEAAKVLREKYDTYLDDINKVITEMGYDPIPKRADYMRHFQEINDKLSEWGVPLNATDMSKDTLPTDINGVTDQFKPGKNWFASAMQRKGFKTTYDAITGIDGYLEGASNLMYHTGDIQRYRTLSKMIREAYGQQHGMDNLDVSTKEGQQRLNDIMDNKLSKYAAWLDEQANALAGKKGGIDRAAERLLGRKIYTVLDTAKKQVGSNMTGFNVRSALTNFASAVQGASKTKKTAFIKGTISTLKNMVHNDGLINKSDFLTNRFGSDQLSKKLWQKASNAGQIFMTGSDYFTANQIWRSKYFENLSKGMNETQAIKNADDFASRIMGDRSKGSTAEIFNSKTLGLLTQFQLEVNNQWSSIVHDNKMDLQKGNKSGATVVFQLGELAAASYFFNNLMKSLTGSDVMIDPIDMLMKMLGADDDDKDKSVGDRATEVIGDLIDDLPFASIMTGGRIPMSEAFKGGGTAFKKLSGQKDQYGNDISWKDVGGDLIESGAYWLLPTGYGQLKKTKNGLSMYDEDLPMPGSYTKSGNLRFRADESAEGKIKAALFGQYSSEEARKYMESGYKTVDKRKLGELQELDFPTSKYLEYKQELSDAGKSNIAKLDYLESTDKYTDREKNIMYKSILNLKDDEINRMNELMDVEEQNEYMYVKTQANAIKRDESLTAPEKKEQIVDLILDTDFDDEALAYLYSKFYTKEEKLQNILNADIPMKEFIKFDSQDFEGEFDKSKGRTKTNSKKNEALQYIQSLKLSAVQKALLAKSKYSSFKQYDKQIAQYIQSRNLSLLDKYKLVKYAGFKSYDKQIANYIAGLNMSSAEKQQLYKDMGFTTHNGRVYYK